MEKVLNVGRRVETWTALVSHLSGCLWVCHTQGSLLSLHLTNLLFNHARIEIMGHEGSETKQVSFTLIPLSNDRALSGGSVQLPAFCQGGVGEGRLGGGEGGVLGLRVPIFSSMMGVVAAESLLQLKRCGEWHDMGIFGTFYYFPQHRNDGPMVTSRWYYFNLYWDTKGQISQYLISRKESK